MIYAEYSTLDDRVAAWWDARGCRADEDQIAFAERQPVETLEAWRDWLRIELYRWDEAASWAEARLGVIEDGEPTDDAGADFDEADQSRYDCRRMLAAVNAKLKGGQ